MQQTTRKSNYAELVLKRGVALQEGQILVVSAPVWTAEFVRILLSKAFELGARDVVVHYSDPLADRIRVNLAQEQALCQVPDWKIESQTLYAQQNACFLRLDSPWFGQENTDARKLALWKQAENSPLKDFQRKKMNNELAWSAVPVPNESWAEQVFPEAKGTQALEKLWEALFASCYVSDTSAVAGWDRHVEELKRGAACLNGLKLRQLHFKNHKGTDLKLELCAGGVFAGGTCHCPEPDGIEFAPNIPTEEILTTPHKATASGVVYNTRPLLYEGSLVDDFWLRFEDGVVVDWECKTGAETLRAILAMDEGSSRLGEVAMVPVESPIYQFERLFYDTLFDENAACHLALGNGYSDVLPGGDRSLKALEERGMNHSVVHVDFMFGSADMECMGIAQDGTTHPIMKNGSFAF